MYKTILVPLDGSKRAEAILPHVEELAHRYEATVIFFQVVELPPLRMPPAQRDPALYQHQIEQRRKDAESYLKAIRGEYKEQGIEARMELGEGNVVEAIINAAERHHADLIALASHGRSGLAQVFYGSVAAGILQRVDRALLLIRARTNE